MSDEIARQEPLNLDTGPWPRLHRVVLVAAGGAVGTAARYLIGAAIPDLGAVPFGILVINVSGAFALGWLVEALALRGPDSGARQSLRLLVGTGLIGGFTTYSALATDVAVLLHDGTLAPALLYGTGTVLIGGIATLLGISLGRHLPRPRGDRS